MFVFVLVRLDTSRIWQVISQVKLSWFWLGSLLIPAEAVFKSLKLKTVIEVRERFSFKSSMASYLIGLPFGAVTPGKVGDLVKISAVRKRTRLDLVSAFSLLMVERLLELLTLLFLALIGLYLLIAKASGRVNLAVPIIATIALIAMMLLFLRESAVRTIARGVANILVPERFHQRLKDNFNEFYAGISAVLKDKRRLVMAIGYSLIAWLVISTRAFCYARSLGIDVAYGYLLFLIPAVIVIELLPISIMGLGTREFALISILKLFGVEPEAAVSMSLMTFVFGPIPLMIIGYVWALRDNMTLKQAEDDID